MDERHIAAAFHECNLYSITTNQEAVRALLRLPLGPEGNFRMETTRKVTQAQIDFGRRLGLELSDKSIGVAHAMIQDAIKRSFLGKNDLGSPSPKQIELAMKFGFDIRHETRGVGDATITDIMDDLNCRAIVEQQLAVGVRVRNKHDTLNREWVISSISTDGTVYFKGGNGARAWARSLVRIVTDEQ